METFIKCKNGCTRNLLQGGCLTHCVSDCCGANKYFDNKGYSHCNNCHKLFTQKDWRKENEELDYCECERCERCKKLIP